MLETVEQCAHSFGYQQGLFGRRQLLWWVPAILFVYRNAPGGVEPLFGTHFPLGFLYHNRPCSLGCTPRLSKVRSRSGPAPFCGPRTRTSGPGPANPGPGPGPVLDLDMSTVV